MPLEKCNFTRAWRYSDRNITKSFNTASTF